MFPRDVGLNRDQYRDARVEMGVPHGCGDEPEWQSVECENGESGRRNAGERMSCPHGHECARVPRYNGLVSLAT